jgi:hypothetical protein
MRGSHTIIYLFDWRQLLLGEGTNPREGDTLKALQRVRQA